MKKLTARNVQKENFEQLKIRHDADLKQVEADYNLLVRKINSSDVTLLSNVTILTQDFQKLVINKLISMKKDAMILGEKSHRLPSFIKRQDLLDLGKSIPPLFDRFIELEEWLARLSRTDEINRGNPERFKAVLEEFKKTVCENSKYQIFLPFIEKYEKGTLGYFNDYMSELKTVAMLTKTFNEFKEKALEEALTDNEDPLKIEQYQILVQIVSELNRISLTQINEEEIRFKKMNLHRTSIELKKLSNEHMNRFRELLPLSKKIEFLNLVLNSQKKDKGKNKATEEDKKTYAPLFKCDKRKAEQGKEMDIIQTLSDLRWALVVAETKRTALCEAPKKTSGELVTQKTAIALSAPQESKKGLHQNENTIRRSHSCNSGLNFFLGNDSSSNSKAMKEEQMNASIVEPKFKG